MLENGLTKTDVPRLDRRTRALLGFLCLKALQSVFDHQPEIGARMRRRKFGFHSRHARCVEMGREAVRSVDRIGDGKAENSAKKNAHDPFRDELAFRPRRTQNLG